MSTAIRLCKDLAANGSATSAILLARSTMSKRQLYDALSHARASGHIKPVPLPHTNARLFVLTDKGRAYAMGQKVGTPVQRDCAPRFVWNYGRVASVFELGSAA